MMQKIINEISEWANASHAYLSNREGYPRGYRNGISQAKIIVLEILSKIDINEVSSNEKTKLNTPNSKEIMNKGEQLGILLDKADVLHNQMNQIFLKQGLSTPELNLLSPDDKEEWHKLYEQSTEVSNEICKLING